MIASDIMTRDVCTISPETSVQDAANLLLQKRISGVPVVGEDGKMIGMLTEADIISKVNRKELTVSDIMSRNIVTVTEERPVDEIASLLTDHKIKRVPVVCNDRLVGIVSRADIVRAVAQGYLIVRSW